MNELLLLGLSHRTAPVAIRERLSVCLPQIETAVADLTRSGAVHEATILSTCNRSEIYVVVPDADRAQDELFDLVARRSGLAADALVAHVHALRSCDVVRHLYRVASGLDSLVLGEHEIQGQVRRAHEAARRAGTSGPHLHRLFNAALRTGKRVRSQTSLSKGRTSVASVAVDLAAETLGGLADRSVLVIGAGETAELASRALSDRGARSLVVTNRHADRARILADRFDGRIGHLHELPDQLVDADVVVSATGSPHAVVAVDAVRRAMAVRAAAGDRRPIVLIDIAVPRDIDPECAAIDGVSLYDLDDLEAVVLRSLQERGAEAAIAEEIVIAEVRVFARWLSQREITPTIVDLRTMANTIVDDVLAENARQWETASPTDLRRIEHATRTVVQRLLHEPTTRLRSAVPSETVHAQIEMLRELFGLVASHPSFSAGGSGEDRSVDVASPTWTDRRAARAR